MGFAFLGLVASFHYAWFDLYCPTCVSSTVVVIWLLEVSLLLVFSELPYIAGNKITLGKVFTLLSFGYFHWFVGWMAFTLNAYDIL